MNAETINTEPSETQLSQDLIKKLKSRRWRMDNLYHIVNEDGEKIPFKMNLVQKILFLGLWFYSVVLKSRQHGITTFFCIFALDYCLFNSNILALFISYTKDEMQETFHNKIKYAYDNLPGLIKQMNPTLKSDANQLRFSNGSSIRVTMSGRGGTYQFVHISEYAVICQKYPRKAQEIKTGTLNAVHPGKFIVVEATAEGREGDFYDLCKKAQDLKHASKDLSVLDPKFFFFGWPTNKLNVLSPRNVVIYDYQQKYFEEIEAKLKISLSTKQKAWYVAKWNQQGDDMKRHHPSTPEEAFEASTKGAYYQSEFTLIRKEKRITTVPYQSNILVDTWWDIGYGDDTVIWFTQDVGREIHVIDYYENSGESFKHFAGILDERKKDEGYRYGELRFPWDAATQYRAPTGLSYVDVARQAGFKCSAMPDLSVQHGIERVRQILRICWFSEEKCPTGLVKLENYRKDWNEKLGCYRETPLRDSNRHAADAFRTFAIGHHFMPAFEVSSMAMEEMRKWAKEKAHPGGWT